MDTKPLLYGLIGFFLGGLLVSLAATTFDKPADKSERSSMSDMSMDDMTLQLDGKKGDDFDRAYIEHMIAHHEGAVEMAALAADNARHAEIKLLSADIIRAQQKEIAQMKKWQSDWGYKSGNSAHTSH